MVSQLWRVRRLMGKELLTGSGSDGAVVGVFGVAGCGGGGGGGGVGVDEEGGDCGALVNGEDEEAVVS